MPFRAVFAGLLFVVAGAITSAAEPDGIYIAIGHGLHRMASNDGVTWTAHEFAGKPAHNQNDLAQAAVGNGVCVAIGGYSKSNILTTKDGVEWTKNKFNAGVLSGIVFLDGRFLAFGQGARVIESNDGEKWRVIGDGKLRDHLKKEAESLGLEKPIKSNIRAWRYVNGAFVGCGDNGFLITTRDLKNWTFPPRIEPRSRLFIESDDNGFVVYGHHTVHHSTDGVRWTDVTPEEVAGKTSNRDRLSSLTHDGERFLVNNRRGQGWESADGKDWQLVTDSKFPLNIDAVRPDLIYSFQTYWKATEDLKYSTDGGKSWQSANIPAPVGITDVIFAPGFPRIGR
ncbi:hypothetical protein [Stratiformator vulcanicus]|uniref:Ycf48-like protein n=1 Tax=Stratiformator vulcanicus TaxID=2527980 RepID=A0A517R1Y5_9PLAN|nr:hypothetical protein [Stratiformator vulcanicus]QDT37896.1 hypothetical protein Pan189_22790 [Stratiformator vulcanicus]